MSNKSFEYYARIANASISNVEKSGRYKMQKEDEKRIMFDILKKLKINPKDSLLDIGCGTGNLSIPLSFFCSKLTAIDNSKVINVLKERSIGIKNISYIKGDFLSSNINDKFDKILIYSIIHYLKDNLELFKFIDKAISLISNGGRLLLGDIPNVSLKTRFMNSKSGKEYIKQWNSKLKSNKINNPVLKAGVDDNQTPIFDDKLITKMIDYIRSKNFNAYLLPQPSNLPFGYTREDILVVSPEDTDIK